MLPSMWKIAMFLPFCRRLFVVCIRSVEEIEILIAGFITGTIINFHKLSKILSV